MINCKRGDEGLPLNYIVITIMLALAIGAIVYFWWNSGIEEGFDQKSCEYSIAQRATYNVGSALEIGREAIPLRCQTNKYCLSSKKDPTEETCKELGSTKENPVKQVYIQAETDREAGEKYLEVIADKLYECHALVGKGEKNFLPSKFWNKKYCLICSRIGTDPELTSKMGPNPPTYQDLYKELEEKKNNEGKSYLTEMYKLQNAETANMLLDNLRTQLLERQGDYSQATDSLSNEWQKVKLPTGGQMAIITMLEVNGYGEEAVIGTGTFLAVTGVAVASAIAALPSGGSSVAAGIALIALVKTSAIGAAGGAVLGGISYGITSLDDEFIYYPPTIQPYDEQMLKSLNCESFELAP
jgi:hypothetical protein